MPPQGAGKMEKKDSIHVKPWVVPALKHRSQFRIRESGPEESLRIFKLGHLTLGYVHEPFYVQWYVHFMQIAEASK